MKATTKHLKPTVVTIGTFDGVHVGHQKIIQRLVKVAKEKDYESIVLTFFPHPRMVLQKDTSIRLINTIAEKEQILRQLGLSQLVVNEFTKEFSRLSAEEFVKNILVDQLNAKHIIIGYDHHFGRNRTANINDLRQFGKVYDFTVDEISAQDIDDVSVSSTKIRKALKEGDIKTANTYLNYNYSLQGKVVKGKGLGRQLGFPTANIFVDEDYKLIPKNGVYIIKTVIDHKLVYGMMNIGTNPTVNGEFRTIEANFFDINKSLYDETLSIEFLDRIRDEVKFNSIDELKAQLNKDKETTTAFINANA